MKKVTLWTKDFTLITLGTIISAIGGTAIFFALSIVVFDNTSSSWFTGVYVAVMLIPSTVLPVVTAPLIDSACRQKFIYRLDMLSGLVYLIFFGFLLKNSFSYSMYMLFGVVIASIGTIYSQAYNSLYPELIPAGFAQKGYSVSSIIYPSAMTVITPIAAIVYSKWGIQYIILAEGILLLIASVFERFIKADRTENREKKRFSAKVYAESMLGGFHYLKKEKGIRSIYSYMAAVNSVANGNNLMAVAHFQSSSILSTAMYSFLISSETLGRMVGGLLHYFVKIPVDKRYRITERVYIIYETMDGIMLLMAYPVMVVIRFVLGFLGVNSATLRAAAVQKYLPSEIRARVDALFVTLISICQILVGLAAGAMGEVLPYRYVTVILGCFGLACAYFFIIRNRREIAVLYNADR